MKARLARWWYAFADAVGAFIEEAAFRVARDTRVLLGRTPQSIERRWWNRAVETPVLVDVWDWTDDRHIFSVLVWPALEVAPLFEADDVQRERAAMIQQVIANGASEMMWSTRFETDYGLVWDPHRQVWIANDGFAYAPPSEARRDQDGVA